MQWAALVLWSAGVTAQGWMMGGWTRPTQEPVIRPDAASVFHDPLTNADVHWEKLHTFNPAAVVKDGKVYVLYRAEDDSGDMVIGHHVSRLGLAVSADGVHFTRMPQPVFYPDKDAQARRESPGGVEDPRVVEAPDGTYVLMYTQWSRALRRFSIGVATSSDLVHWAKHGPAFGDAGKYATLAYKSASVVTELKDGHLVAAKLHGKYWMYWGEIEVHLASSDDLVHWTPVEDASGKPKVLLRRRKGLADSGFPECGPPALLTRDGVVLIYNAKNATNATQSKEVGPAAYAVLEALFSKDDLTKLVARTDTPVLKPELAWEKSGQYRAGTTFAEGLVWFKDAWWMYYGSADSFVGVATAK